MHSAFNLFVFPNYMFTSLLLVFFISKGYELSGEIALKNNHYYYYYFRLQCEISILQVSVTLRTILLMLKHEIILCICNII